MTSEPTIPKINNKFFEAINGISNNTTILVTKIVLVFFEHFCLHHQTCLNTYNDIEIAAAAVIIVPVNGKKK